MCLFRHKWSKWTLAKRNMIRTIRPVDIIESYWVKKEEYEFTQRYQHRTCDKCGLYQEKVI